MRLTRAQRRVRQQLQDGAHLWPVGVDEIGPFGDVRVGGYVVAVMDPDQVAGLDYTEPVQRRTLLALRRRGLIDDMDIA